MYEKIRGHHCWWLSKNGKSIGNFDINGNTTDAEAEGFVDEIVELQNKILVMQAELVLVSMMAADTPMFNNPLHAMQARQIRDRTLAAA